MVRRTVPVPRSSARTLWHETVAERPWQETVAERLWQRPWLIIPQVQRDRGRETVARTVAEDRL